MSVTISARDLRLRIGQRIILDGVDLDADPGSVVALVGPSGAGKTTLLHALLGLQRLGRGTVRIGGDPIERLGGRARAARLGWLPQVNPVQEPMRVLDFVAAARYHVDEGRGQALAGARDALEICGIERLSGQSITSLSGGEGQRVAVAALIAQNPAFLLLDEPSNHLDVRRQQELYTLLGREWRAGRGLLLITHDVNLLAALEPPDLGNIRVLAMKSGRIAWELPYDSTQLPDALSELMEIPMRAVDMDGRRHIVPEWASS